MKFNDLNKRIMVAFWGIPLIFFLIFWGKIGIFLFVLFISIGIIVESFNMMKKININLYFYPLLTAAIVNPVMIFWQIPLDKILMFWFLVFLYMMFMFLKEQEGNPLSNLAFSMIFAIYGIILPAYMILIRESLPEWFHWDHRMGAYLVFSWFVMIWMCDTFAYFGGTLWGKHKLAPKISPNKSVEGFLFGLIGAILVSLLIYWFKILPFSLKELLVLGIIIGIFAQIGDLVESRIKRIAGVKDSSNLLPGHGGIMDRFDSIVFTTPMVFIYIYTIAYYL